ncbi:MAG TPA: hypothetical protein VFI23_10610 [Rhizomicrobium sp.]|nr:hypothetical protein [Rhizomicrobium sp.]
MSITVGRAGEARRFAPPGLELAVAGCAIALLAGALAANQTWFDRHFLPLFAVPRPALIAAEQGLRACVLLAAILLLLIGRRPIARLLRRASAGTILRLVLACVLALGAAELILRVHPLRPHDADPFELEPRRQPDPLLGWRFVPSRLATAQEGGRAVSYSFDAAGQRVPAPGETVDVARPTLVFTGESIIAGFGLAWDETIPARAGAALGLQSANLAVSDYSNDQSTLRLKAELPRFQKPAAVVTLFMPSLLDRNLLVNRPHLGPGLSWQPPAQQWRLAALLHWLVPYRGTATIDQGILHTRDSLAAMVQLACARGAQPLIVVPQFGDASPVEDSLRRRVLDEAGLPYVRVKLDPAWHLPGDPHPDARGARAIADALVARLKLNAGPDGAGCKGNIR